MSTKEESRQYHVVKANEIIQRAKYDLSTSQIKLFCFCVSKIKPNDKKFMKYSFTYNEYFETLGLDRNNGKNIRDLENNLKILRDTSFILLLDNGENTSCGWLDKYWFKNGNVKVRFDDDIQEYLIDLINRGNYTQYQLLYTLSMSSKYSIRLYEYFKSILENKKRREKVISLDEFKDMLSIEKYRYIDIKRRILDVSQKEINDFTDLYIIYEPIAESGRKVSKIKFSITLKDTFTRFETSYYANTALDG